MAARRSAADHMDDAAKAGTDPDYLFFLRHLYPSGTSYVLDIPAADGGSRPPVVIKYEQQPVFGAGPGIEGVGEHEPEPAVIDPPPAVREDDGASSSRAESNGAQEVSVSVSYSTLLTRRRAGGGGEEKGTAGKEE